MVRDVISFHVQSCEENDEESESCVLYEQNSAKESERCETFQLEVCRMPVFTRSKNLSVLYSIWDHGLS